MNFPEVPHVPGLLLKALCPSLTPALENPKLARAKTEQMPRETQGLGTEIPPLPELNCALHPLSACQSHAFFSRWVFLARGTGGESG